jgi:hypothetical protein
MIWLARDPKGMPSKRRIFIRSWVLLPVFLFMSTADRARVPDVRSADGPRLFRAGVAANIAPLEVFGEIGLAIKKGAPIRRTFTIELANGSYGYLPTPRHHALGGYETWMGTSRVEIEASNKIERAILDLFEGLKRGRVERERP